MTVPEPASLASKSLRQQRAIWPRRLVWRLGLGFGALLGLMLLGLGVAGWQLHAMSLQTERFATQDMQRLLRVQVLSLTTEGAANALLRLMNAPRDQRVPVYADVDERNRRIDGIVVSLDGQLGDTAQEQTLTQLVAARAAYFKAFLATVDQIEAGDSSAAMHAYSEQVQPTLAALLTLSNALVNRERGRIEAQVKLAQQRFEQLTLWAAALSVLSVLLAVVLALHTTRSVVEPMRQLEAAAKRIAVGDYVAPCVTGSTDEVDRVAQSMTHMTEAIAQREQEIERLAFRDPLTDLPNRTFLLKANTLVQPVLGAWPMTAATSPSPADAVPSLAAVLPVCKSLLLFDLARLKTINATLGFATGDSLIKEVARRTQAVLQPLDQVAATGLVTFSASNTLLAHVSGGMFAIVSEVNERTLIAQFRQQLTDIMAQPMQCNGHTVDLSLVFGLADSPPGQVEPLITLLRNAEIALGAAKQAAQPFTWYNPAQEAARLSHLGLLSDLRLAAQESQLQMWLQPKFSLLTGLPVGAEALVRWQHPQRGFISPTEFIPFAEQTGAITLVTNWMLSQAMTTLQVWQHSKPDWSLSVNVSMRDLQDPTFYQRVKRLIQQHSVDPQHLRLEIVESGLMQDAHTSIALLHSLRDAGVQLSIDDFGTGYSSLAYLQQLPVSELKIDRSFVIDIDAKPLSQRLVKTMIDLGHGMDLLVTAEGIETPAERDIIQLLGCDVMQGYLGSRPLHGSALQAWLDGLQV